MMIQHQNPLPSNDALPKGILLVDKPIGKTSFNLVAMLRKRLGVRKIGHCGTLDPLASGLMVMLIGRDYTRLSDKLLCQDKEYLATVRLGIETSTYDAEGEVTASSEIVPTLDQLQEALKEFQGEVLQVPPMFSAKKQNGRKLYELARKGIVVEREAVRIDLNVELISYDYPNVDLRIACSKGTYIRTLAYDLGQILMCGAHLSALRRTRSGDFSIDQAIDGTLILSPTFPIEDAIKDSHLATTIE